MQVEAIQLSSAAISSPGRSGLVRVGEDECREWCKEQRLQKARSQALHSTHSGSSMNRQGSVLVSLDITAC